MPSTVQVTFPSLSEVLFDHLHPDIIYVSGKEWWSIISSKLNKNKEKSYFCNRTDHIDLISVS
jgi:hypothetical protein